MINEYRKTKSDVRVGQRVEIAPHYDLWARGARYGVIHYMEFREGNQSDKPRALVKMDHPRVKKLARIPLVDLTFL